MALNYNTLADPITGDSHSFFSSFSGWSVLWSRSVEVETFPDCLPAEQSRGKVGLKVTEAPSDTVPFRYLQLENDQVEGGILKIDQLKRYGRKIDQLRCIGIAVDPFFRLTSLYDRFLKHAFLLDRLFIQGIDLERKTLFSLVFSREMKKAVVPLTY